MKRTLSILLAVAIMMLSLGITAFAGVADDYYYYSSSNNYVINIINPTTPTYSASYSKSIFNSKNVERFAILSTITKNGTTTATPQFGKFNETVEVVLYPDDGYTVESINVVTLDGKQVQLYKGEGNVYYFAMPAEKVVVDASYAPKKTIPVVPEKPAEPTKPAVPSTPSIPVVPEKTPVVVEPVEVEEAKSSSGIWVLLGAVVIIGGVFVYKKKKGNGAGPLL